MDTLGNWTPGGVPPGVANGKARSLDVRPRLRQAGAAHLHTGRYTLGICQIANVIETNIQSEVYMGLNVYLSGEIHTDWRDQIIDGAQGLDLTFSGPVTDHAASDDCGVAILGDEPNKYWHDHKGAMVNAIRTRKGIGDADVVVVRFGEKYKQWNAAFDAGYAAALGKSLIILQQPDHDHALKEVDAAALAVAREPSEVVEILRYVLTGALSD
jgi:YtoQ family protein